MRRAYEGAFLIGICLSLLVTVFVFIDKPVKSKKPVVSLINTINYEDCLESSVVSNCQCDSLFGIYRSDCNPK